jgi:hypothetical protein
MNFQVLPKSYSSTEFKFPEIINPKFNSFHSFINSSEKLQTLKISSYGLS